MEPQSLRWVPSNTDATKVQVCNNVYFLGGTEVFASNGDYIQRTYENLPSHNTVAYYIKIILVDLWMNNDQVNVLINGYEVGFQSNMDNINSYGSYACGNSSLAELEITSYGYVPHTASSLVITITNKRTTATVNGTILFSDINLMFKTMSTAPTVNVNYSYPIVPITSYTGYPTCTYATYYDSTSSSCKSCDSGCDYCYGGTSADCFKCASGKFYNGTHCTSCDSSCAICHGITNTTCDYCVPPYYFLDDSCVSCDSPFVQSYEYFGYCSYPCQSSGEYLYSDGSCYTTCDSRLNSTTKYSKAVCNFPCSSSSETLYYDGHCVSLDCPYPLELTQYGSYYICEYPCASGLLLYANGSCLDPAGCVYPFVKHTYTDYNSWDACGGVCTYGLYRYNNDSCHEDCPSPLVAKTTDGILICDPPRCGPNQCSACYSDNTCPAYYVCNVYLGSWCLFEYTYSLVVQSLKTVTNGVVLSVTVSPMMGIGEFNDDVLTSDITVLTKGEDYTVSIKKVATGSFEVAYVFYLAFDESKILGTMYYSPSTLDLEQTFSFPHITYISEEVQQAADNVSATSQITFILFLISIFGMIFGGGITSLWTSVPESQYTYYLIYLNVDYLHHTTVYLQSLSSYDFLNGDTSGDDLDVSLKPSLPTKFFNMDYSPDFYENTDQVFLQLVLMICGLIAGTLSLRYLRYPKDLAFIQKAFSFVLGIVKYNGIMRQFMTYILPFSTASFIQIYAAVFGQVKQSLFSLILAPATMVVVVWFLAKTRNLIAYLPNEKYQRIEHQRLFGTLWENLELHSIGKYYFWFGSIRNIVLAYVAVFFEFSPYVQILVLIGYQLGMVLLFFKRSVKSYLGVGIRRVFEDKALTIITLIQEALLLLMKLMILLFLYCEETATDSTLVLIGWMIILPGIFSQVVQTGFSLLNQVRNRQKLWRKLRVLFYKMSFQKKKKKIRRIRMIKQIRKPILKDEVDGDREGESMKLEVMTPRLKVFSPEGRPLESLLNRRPVKIDLD